MQQQRSSRKGAAIAVVAVAALLGPLAPPAHAGGKSVFTSAQASSGAKEYAKSCAVCHGAALQGTSAPALKGKSSGIAQQSVAQVYSYISQQMPLTRPAGLSSAQYLNIMAFILKQNGHRAGSSKLTLASARANQDTLSP